MERKKKKLSCIDCAVLNCHKRTASFPQFCLTINTADSEIEEAMEIYRSDALVAKMSLAAAKVEGTYHGKLTRVEEIIAFARRIEARKIGIATCVGLVNEAKTFVKILEAKGFTAFGVLCKVGGIDKTELGVPEDFKINKGCHESICNPVLQAKLLNKEETDLNVIIGLCVGHDSMFIKYSEAPVTTLITKDRVLGHNPAAALYSSYYKNLLQPGDI